MLGQVSESLDMQRIFSWVGLKYQMTRARAIAAACLLDWIAGDPEWFPHPVRWMGRYTQLAESLLRRPGQSASDELLAGAALTAVLVGASYLGTAKAIQIAYRLGTGTGLATEILLGWTCIASRNLIDESLAVIRALEEEDILRARQRLSRIVGRDTQSLSETEINRAVIETLGRERVRWNRGAPWFTWPSAASRWPWLTKP